MVVETQAEAPAVALSREELWAVMRLIRAPWVPGIEPIDVEHPLASQQAERVDEGARALIARGLLTITPPAATEQMPEATLPAPVIALVGTCACSRFDLFLSLQKVGQPQMAHFHQVGALGVAHTMPQPGVHFFEPLPGQAGVLSAAAEMLALDAQQALPIGDGVIAAPKLRQVHECAPQTPTTTIAQILREGGLNAPMVDAVSGALRSPLATGVIMVTRPSAGPTEGALLGVIVTPETCFTLIPSSDASHYTVRPGSAHAIRQWITEQLPA